MVPPFHVTLTKLIDLANSWGYKPVCFTIKQKSEHTQVLKSLIMSI